MSDTFNAANMVKLSTDAIEGMKFTELERCKDIIQRLAKKGERVVNVDVAKQVRTFVRVELEALGFKVELGYDVMISW